jgi:RPA family protein
VDDRVAFKLSLGDIIERPLHTEEGRLSFIEYNDENISTVRVMGIVVSKYEAEKYVILTLDDTTETISVRAFGEDKTLLDEVHAGETIDVIGTLREFEEEVYLVPRTVWRVGDPNWEIVRNLELLLRSKKPLETVPSEEVLESEGEDEKEDLKPQILNLIEKFDNGDGTDYKTLLKESKLEDNKLDLTLNNLLADSEIYEPKIGRFKKI